MSKRPIVTVEKTAADRLMEVAAWTGMIICWMLVMFFYSQLPEIIPVHFNLRGEPDRYGDKIFIVSLPVIATLLFFLLSWIKKYPHHFNYPVKITPANAKWNYTVSLRIISYLQLVITYIFAYIVYEVISQAIFDNAIGTLWFLPVVLGLTLLPVAFYFFKARAENKL